MPSVSEIAVKISADAKELVSTLDESKEHLETFGTLAEGILQGFGLALGQMSFEALAHSTHHLLEEFIEVNSAAEVWTAQMSLLTGSVSEAKDRVEALSEFAKKAPFELSDIREANRLLQVFGGNSLAGEKGMKLIGDAASFAQKPITEVAELVGRLHQALESGSDDPRAIMVLRRMGVLSGDAAGELTKLVKAHADGTQIWDAFTKAIGRTSGQMDVMMKTFRGQQTNLADIIHEIIHEVGAPFFDAAKAGLLSVLEWLNGAKGKQAIETLVELGVQAGAWAKEAGPKFFTAVADGIVRFMDWITSDSGKQTIHTLGELAKWLGILSLSSFAFTKAMSLVIEPLIVVGKWALQLGAAFKTLGLSLEVFEVFGGTIGAVIEALSGPIGWIIAAVGALVLAWRNDWGQIREWAADMIAEIIHWFRQMITENASTVVAFMDAWKWLKSVFTYLWNEIVQILSLVWDEIKTILGTALKIILDVFGFWIDFFTGNWSGAWNHIKDLFTDVWNGLVQFFGRIATWILSTLSRLTGAMEKLPGASWLKGTTAYLKEAASMTDDYLKDINKSYSSSVTEQDKLQARMLLGLTSFQKALADHPGGTKPSLAPGNPGLNTHGGDSAKGKGKESDPNDDLKSQIAELAKQVRLGADATDYAKLKYDLYIGSLKGAKEPLKQMALGLQDQVDKMELLKAANDDLREKMAGYRREIALGENASKEATLQWELMNDKAAAADPLLRAWTLQLGLHAIEVEKNRALSTKYHEAISGLVSNIRGLFSENDALGISLMGTAAEWDKYDAKQKAAALTLAKFSPLFEDLKSKVSGLRDKLKEARGDTTDDLGLSSTLEKASTWLKSAPAFSASQVAMIASVSSMVNELRALDKSMKEITADKRAKEIASAFAEASKSIDKDIAKLKQGDLSDMNSRWSAFWADQQSGIEKFVASAKPSLMTLVNYIGLLKQKGTELFKAQDDASYLKNYEDALKRIKDAQEKNNQAFAEWVSTTHSAKVAAVEFIDGVRQMTRQQAELIAKSQEDTDARAKQIEQLKSLGQKAADMVGKMIDEVVHGKIQGLFRNTLAAFKAMLQDMAAEYLKAQITKGIMNLFSGFAGAASGGGSGGSGDTNATPLSGAFGSSASAPALAAGAVRASRLASAYGTSAMAGGPAVNIVMHVHTPDVGGFRKSQRQIMAEAYGHAQNAAKRAGQ